LNQLKSSDPQEYRYLLEQLVEARQRYTHLNFKETTGLLQHSKEQPTKKVATLLSWF
jgi:hypothetical protein